MAQTLIQRSRSKRPSEKAYWHNEAGAGKSRIVREFFGLTSGDEQAIENELGIAVDVNLRQSEG